MRSPLPVERQVSRLLPAEVSAGDQVPHETIVFLDYIKS